MNSPTILFNKVAEVRMFYRNPVKASERVKITNSKDCYELFVANWDDTMELYETFKILMLNKANKVLGISLISTGGVAGTVVDPKRIFQTALKVNASGIILSHNHPSGSLTPSEADCKITRKVKEAGLLLEISVLDHLILSTDGYYSFADEGAL